MWEWNEERQEFYLHQFTKEQPDLNYNNPKVHDEMISVMKFWLDLGVDGFRVDALPHLYENENFEDESPAVKKIRLSESENPIPTSTVLSPDEYGYWDHKYTFNLPQTLELLEKFRKICDEYADRDGHTRYHVAYIRA